MNPHKKKIGCLVPVCMHPWCDRKKKKICALRKYFLIEQKEARAQLNKCKSGYFSRDTEIMIKKKIYWWRDYDKKRKAK